MVQFALQLMPLIVAVVVWQAMVSATPGYDFTFGSPQGIAREVGVLTAEGSLWSNVGVTAIEAVLGFLAGSAVGTMVGLTLWLSKTAYTIARPYLIALGAVPVFALAPVLIFWFGTGIWSKVVLGFLSTFVVAVSQAHTGAKEADPNLIRLTQAFGGTKAQVFLKIIVPSAAIWVIAGVRVNIGMSLLGAFVGEFISSRTGLGHMIIVAEGLYNVNQIWVGVIGLVAIALFFHLCTWPIERWALRWK